MHDGGPRARVRALLARARRVERRELREFRRWIEDTGNLLRVTVLVAVPSLVALVTVLSNAVLPALFLLYPPLASGTYTLFADPEGSYSEPLTFVGGMTLGALAGWTALVLTGLAGVGTAPGAGLLRVSAAGAALAVLLTAVLTWALDLEEPTAFSTALLVLVTGQARLQYVLGVAVSSALVAGAFLVWRERFYERRARLLYRPTAGDDRVLVPMRSEPHRGRATAAFAGRIAAAHDAGRVVLFDVVEEPAGDGDDDDDEPTDVVDGDEPADRDDGDEPARDGPVPDRPVADGGPDPGSGADAPGPTDRGTGTDAGTDRDGRDGHDPTAVTGAGRDGTAGTDPGGAGDADGAGAAGAGGGAPGPDATGDARADGATHPAAAGAAGDLRSVADLVERETGAPCEVAVVAAEGGWSPDLVVDAVEDVGCDLIVTPYERRAGALSPFVRSLFGADVDTVAFRSEAGDREWTDALVSVRRRGALPHAMVEFARRVTRGTHVAVGHCVRRAERRREAERELADLVDAFPGHFETRVDDVPVDRFLADHGAEYDVVFVGASEDRSPASRFLSPPTFERLDDVGTDVAVVHRGR